MVLLLVRSSGGSDLHWLVVRLRGGLVEPTAGYSRSRDSALLLLGGERKGHNYCCWGHTCLVCAQSRVMGDPVFVQVRDALEGWDRQAQPCCSTASTHISVTHGHRQH